MKDYKAEIENEIKEAFADGCAFADGYDEKIKGTLKDRTNKILSLIREIAKEAVGEMEKVPEVVQTKGIHFVNEHKPIHRNQLRSEILSNVEEALK